MLDVFSNLYYNNKKGEKRMADLISREAAIAKIKEWCAMEEAKCVLIMLPAVDTAPVIHGRWIKMIGMMPPEYHGHYECSECQWNMKGISSSWIREEEFSYCPNCGAKMDKKEEENKNE